MMSAAASFIWCSPKVVSPRRSKNNSKVKGIRLLLDPPSRVEGCPKRSKKEKSSFFSGISPLERLPAPVQAFQLGDSDEVAAHSCM